MAWALLDDGFCNHPKVVALIFHPTADGPRALSYWTVALSWACKYTADKAGDEQGVIPPGQLRAWGKLMNREHEAAEALADVGLWDRLDGGHYRIHNFRQWARLDQREARQRGGRMTAQKRWGTELPLEASSSANRSASSSATDEGVAELLAPGSYTNTDTEANTNTEEKKNTSAASAAFDEFWKMYPRREGKDAARRRWARVITKTDPATVIAGAKVYAELCERKRTETKYIAHPATWLNAGRWMDDPEPESPTTGGVREVAPYE